MGKTLILLFIVISAFSCDKNSNSNTNNCSKKVLLDLWYLDEIEIIQPPDGSSLTSWKNILSNMGSTSALGNGACTFELINIAGINEWIVNGAEIYNPLIKSICCPKYNGPIYKFKGRFTFNSQNISFIYLDDQNQIYQSEVSTYLIKDCKLTINLLLKNNEKWRFVFI